MNLRLGLWTVLLGLLVLLESPAQSNLPVWSPTRSKMLLPGTDSLFLDSLPVVPRSIGLFDLDSLPSEKSVRFRQKPFAHLLLNDSITDTLWVRYRVLELPLNEIFQHKDTSIILPDHTTQKREELYEANAGSESFKPFSGLNSSGSISRSVSVGNNQDAVLNSNLNLQLSGNLGQNTQIRASITDNNIPIQADGYTQQLREFDRVYIELENPDFGMLRAGDYNMTSVDNYFLKFDKRISGAGVFTNFKAGESNIPLQLQGGIARGKFARNRFQAQEGNLGPYKLTGANGEQFIIIISGSERVYINGVLLKRGQQNDYVIDYNAGELTFTTLQPVTKESRVVVEFQYTEQNYLRSAVFGQTGFESDNVKTAVQFYNEQDSKNQSLLRDLTDEEKRVLSEVGDDVDEALVSTIAPSSYSDDLILYRLTDSLGHDSVLVYTPDSTGRLYQASFTYLGPQRGNYILANNDANGRVFRWVPPANGVPQGRYEPVRQIVAPTQLQVLTVRTEAKIGDKNLLNIDLAGSKNDVNLFSDKDEGNDVATAGKFRFSRKDQVWDGELASAVNYEYNQDDFRTVERIRRVEFARDWNLPLNYDKGLQMAGVSLGFARNATRMLYQGDYLQLNGYSGVKNNIGFRLKDDSNVGQLSSSWLTTKDSIGSTDFLRERGEFAHFFTPDFWAGVRSEGEWNERRANNVDTLRRSSYRFIEYQAFAGFGDTTESFTEIHYMERWDDTARFGNFMQFSKVESYGINSHYETNFNSTLTGKVNRRSLKVTAPEELEAEKTTTMRVNYLQRIFQNNITSTTFYEAGSGTEPRRSFSYIEVPAGTGSYTHTDYNNNGIKELGEFEVAPTPDLARYVRVFTPSNEYLRTSIQRFGQNLNINAPSRWRTAEDMRATLSRFSLLLNYQLDRKTLLSGQSNRINPFAEIADDSLIVAMNNNFRNTVFFNRSSNILGASYTYRATDNRNLLSFGVEQRTVQAHSGDIRYRPFDFWLIKAEGSIEQKVNRSGNFTRRNFTIDQIRNDLSLSYQPGDALTITARYQVDHQESLSDDNNLLVGHTTGMDFSYNNADKISAQVSLNYVKNNFEGLANSPAGFEMLQALRPGDNGTWSVVLQRTMRKNILISLNYSGRVSEDSHAIHTGNLEIKAFF